MADPRSSGVALQWAAADAIREHAPLRITEVFEVAIDQAEAMGPTVVAVHAWHSPFSTYENGRGKLLFDHVWIHEATRALVSESLAGARADRPDVEVELIPGQVARAIMPAGESAESADVVVVGSRGGWRLHQPAPRLRQPERPAPRPLPGRHRSLRIAVYGLSAAVRR